MRAILILFMLLIPAFAVDPSSLIVIDAKPELVSLSGASETSLTAIDGLNQNLSSYAVRELADLGHYYSGVRESTQALEEVSPVQLQFVNIIEPIPENVGNATNSTIVTNATNGLMWVT